MQRIAAALVLAVCAFAQTRGGLASKAAPPAATPGKWPILTLTVEGNKVFPTAAILTVAGLKIGQVAGEPEFDAARDRLTATGAFETVGYKFDRAADGKGYRASFEVTETTSIYPVKFEDLGVPDADLAAALAARDPLFSMASFPGNLVTLDREAAWTEEFLASRGIHEKVAAQVTNFEQEKLVALFRPAKALPAVSTITFEGNHIVPGIDLRMAITGAGIGSSYIERNFRQILETSVRPVYEARGRMHATFPKIRTEEDSDVKGVHVIVTVDEGEVYTLHSVTIAKLSPLAEDRLLKQADIKTGGDANFDLVQAGLDRVKAAVHQAGYLDVKVSMDRQLDDAKKTADVIFHIDSGPQYHMGKLFIKGLDLNGEAEMKRIWTMKLGAVYDPGYPNHFLESVRAQGLFDHLGKTTADTRIDAKANSVDVTLTFAVDDAQKNITRRKR